MIIVGNKTDVEGKRVVDKEQGQAIAAEHNVRYFETSAKARSIRTGIFKLLLKGSRTILVIS